MKRTFVVGTVALAFTFIVAGVSACGSNGTGSSKSAGKAPATAPVAGPAQPSAGQPTAVPVAMREPAGTTVPEPAGSDMSKGVKFSLVLAEGKTGFKVNGWALSDEATATIDEMFAGGKADLGAHFLIEGYTDNLGSPELNKRIGLGRAEAVRQYLIDKYEIAPTCIKVVSYGLEQPVGDNATEEGRAMNRRVVIKVLD